jgi:hypothetical protein
MNKTSNKISYPVTLQEARTALGLGINEGDPDKITLDFQSATEDIEMLIGKDIALTDNSINEYSFSGSSYTVYEGNLRSIHGVYANDQTIGYTLKNVDDGKFEISLNNSISDSKLTVSYRSGYEDSKCPLNLKKFILRVTKDNYDIDDYTYLENGVRENYNAKQRLIQAFRKINF